MVFSIDSTTIELLTLPVETVSAPLLPLQTVPASEVRLIPL